MEFDPLSLLILRFRGRSVAVFRNQCLDYDSVVAVARRNLPSLQPIPSDDLVLMASIPGYPDTNQVELPKEIWPSVSSVVRTVTIALESEMQPPVGKSSLTSRISAPRKPVIYLYPPSRLQDVIVDLFLTSSWSFSAVYPSPQTASIPSGENQIGAQSLTWAIEAEPDGKLVEKTTGVEVTYLYWEATANRHLVTPDASRATTPIEDIEAFDPSRPTLSPADSILLPIGKIPGYLDVALKALTLHAEARTSFITYWLPSLLKHEYIALRFITQESYEKAAQMRISPAPDIVTRVFMLFRGVRTADVGFWEAAAARATAEDGETFWPKVVGVDPVRASDRTLFRVLEWGGMEVE